MLARLLVVALQFVCFMISIEPFLGVTTCDSDGVVCGDVWALVWVVGRGSGVQAVEVFLYGSVLDDMREGRGVRFADGFTVPACALGVDFVEHFLVGFGCPFKSVGELGLVDFVVMVDEDARLGDGVIVVISWRELVRVPC